MKTWPKNIQENLSSIVTALRFMGRARDEDINIFNNLNSVFMAGRKVGKIPTSSTDTDAKDKIGDFNYDASYFYLCVDNAGAAEWRRASLGAW